MNATSTGAAVTAMANDGEQLMLILARELAADIYPLETILKNRGISADKWEAINGNRYFQRVLSAAIEQWNSPMNTAERVKLKALCFVEETMPEFFARAHDPKEVLSSKVEVLKTMGKFADLGIKVEGSGGEKFSVTINLGADDQMKVTGALPTQVIDAGDQ